MTHYSMTITDHPLSHICQQTECAKTTRAHVSVTLNDEPTVIYDVCWEHARDLMLAPVDVLELSDHD